jgi:hypothetical protein
MEDTKIELEGEEVELRQEEVVGSRNRWRWNKVEVEDE